MGRDWQELTKLVGAAPIEVERVRLVESGVAIEGPFSLPPLAQLTAEDQVFVAAFVRCHGSIKQMEQYFGVSYPDHQEPAEQDRQPVVVCRNRTGIRDRSAAATRREVLDRLSRGELTVAQALERLKER